MTVSHKTLWDTARPVERETCRLVKYCQNQPDESGLAEYVFCAEIEPGLWGIFVTPYTESRGDHV